MDSYTVDQFVQLEKQVLAALVSGDASADARLLTSDFLGVYESGFAGRTEHAGQLEAGPTIARYELSEARIRVLAEEVVLLSYRVQFVRFKNQGDGLEEAMYVSSIWRFENGAWKNSFSQDTPVISE